MSSKSSAKKSKPVPGAARRAAGRGETAGSGLTPTSGDRLPIVGLGRSAARAAFIGARPAKKGLSIVVGEHLDRTHENLMPELLARSTTPRSIKRWIAEACGSINHSFRSLTDEQHGAIGATTSLNRH